MDSRQDGVGWATGPRSVPLILTEKDAEDELDAAVQALLSERSEVLESVMPLAADITLAQRVLSNACVRSTKSPYMSHNIVYI